MNESASQPRFSTGVIAVIIFTAIYLLASVSTAFGRGNLEFIFYIVVMSGICAGILLLHWRVRLSTALLWALSIWGLLHMAGGLVSVPESWPINGDVRVLYSWWIIPKGDGPGGYLKYDNIVHAYGFAIATWMCWEALQGAIVGQIGQRPRATVGLMLLCFAAGCGLGAFNEIVEFAATMMAETNVGGYVNTGWDLVSNAVGCAVAVVLIWLLEH